MLAQLDHHDYYILHNLILQITPGRTLLIEHLVISTHGIFVIKLCEKIGRIEGAEHGDFWVKILQYKKRFPNPLQQCKVQTKALRELFSNARVPITPIVLFNIFTEVKADVAAHLIDVEDLLPTIKSYEKVYLKAEQMQAIISMVEGKRAKKVTTQARIYDIRELLQERNRLVKADICPKCNSALMIREGKHGTYKSCSKYPKCKFLYAISAQRKEL